MQTENYTTAFEVPKTPAQVYTAINNIALWWTQNVKGASTKINDEFTVTFGKTFITLKVVELVNNTKVVWLVTDCHKHFLKNKKEWVGTTICFDIAKKDTEKTRLVFTHVGLAHPLECFQVCSDAWNGYLQGSLKKLIKTGKGTPDEKG